jgi:hypothetical protein
MAYKKLTKKEKVLNLLTKGNAVTWSSLRRRFDLKSPRAMIDQLRTVGHMVYINTTSTGCTTYRMGKPTKWIIAAGVDKVFYFGKDEKTTNLNEIVAAGIESIYGTQKYAYSNR